MPGEVIDYIAATLGLLLIFMIVTSSFLFMTAPVLNYTAMRDRVTVSSNMIDYLLLSQGVPENWGFKENVSVFGLAQEKAPNYYVDPFKLMRIWNATSHPDFPYLYIIGYVDFGWTKQILGITRLNTFQVIFRPAMAINVTERSANEVYWALFDILVHGGSGPIPSASVNATFVFAQAKKPGGGDGGQQAPDVMLLQANNVTDVTGHTLLNFTLPREWEYIKQSYTLVVHASLAGISGSKFHSSRITEEPLIKVYINGTTVSVAHPHLNKTEGKNPKNPDDVRFYNITFAPPFSRTGYNLVDLPEPNGSKMIPGQASLTSAGYLTPGMFCIGVDEAGLAEKNKPPAVYLIPWGISAMGVTVVYGDNPVGQGPVVTVERVVTVGEETYIAILAFWSRESRTVYPTPGTPS